MNRKQQRRLDSIQHIISSDDLEREISRSETRVLSARDSIGDFLFVLTIAFLIGITSIATAAWYAQALLRAGWHGLQLSLAVFAFFSLYRHIEIWISIRPEESYKKKLLERRHDFDYSKTPLPAPSRKARPTTKEVEFE